MTTARKTGISFQLNPDQISALKQIGGDRTVRLAGKVSNDTFHIDFVACNAPFTACNSAFAACNSAFSGAAKPKLAK